MTHLKTVQLVVPLTPSGLQKRLQMAIIETTNKMKTTKKVSLKPTIRVNLRRQGTRAGGALDFGHSPQAVPPATPNPTHTHTCRALKELIIPGKSQVPLGLKIPPKIILTCMNKAHKARKKDAQDA